MERVLVWAGVLLMLVSLVWWQLLPRAPLTTGNKIPPPAGPITRVVIDAGHGGNDSGAMRNGVEEKNLTLDVARRLDQLLRGRGLATFLTRSGDETVSLSQRAAVANRERECVFISIHFDEGGRGAATGVQTFYAVRQATTRPAMISWLPFLRAASSAPNNLESQSLAGFVQDSLVRETQAFNRGTTAEQFYVVANVQHPAVLVEGGFLSNDNDLAQLTSEEYRQKLAGAIDDGIMRYREVAGRARPTLAVDQPQD